MNIINSVIFDADGMIIHGTRFSERLEKDFGISRQTTNRFFTNEFQQCLIGKADLKRELVNAIKEWGWPKSVDDLLAYWFDEKANKIQTRFGQITKDLRAKGVLCYLATNNEEYRLCDLQLTRGLNGWFNSIFPSCYLGCKKPEKDFFQKIQDRLGTEKSSVLFWDDDPENVEGAKAFGWNAELYTDFESFVKKMSKLSA